MDASQYKDYVLFMLFIKYITDKYGNSDDFAPPVTIPQGASFKDIVALKGRSDIGDKINTQVIQPRYGPDVKLHLVASGRWLLKANHFEVVCHRCNVLARALGLG